MEQNLRLVGLEDDPGLFLAHRTFSTQWTLQTSPGPPRLPKETSSCGRLPGRSTLRKRPRRRSNAPRPTGRDHNATSTKLEIESWSFAEPMPCYLTGVSGDDRESSSPWRVPLQSMSNWSAAYTNMSQTNYDHYHRKNDKWQARPTCRTTS